MTKILLIRHGEAAKSPKDPDPGLTELGNLQARKLADHFADRPRLELVSSPKARTRQTAQPLADLWQCPVIIEDAVIELPSPAGVNLSERGDWLRDFLDSEWDSANRAQSDWRRNILDYLKGLNQDTAVFCHFMVINSVVAHIRGDTSVQQFRPDYTSVTELCLEGDALELVTLGKIRNSRIL